MQGMQVRLNIKQSVNIIFSINKFLNLYVHFSRSKILININTIFFNLQTMNKIKLLT